MKLILIGHTGVVGTIVHEGLKNNHSIDIITASRSTGNYKVNIENSDSVKDLFESVGKVDAIISTAGSTIFKPFSEMTPQDNLRSIHSKLQGQVNIAVIGHKYLNDNGSITLTSGIVGDDSIPMGSSSALVNGAIDAFIKSSAFEMDRGIRINAVSPGPVMGSWDIYADYFRGILPVEDSIVLTAYEKSLFGIMTGQVFKPR